MRLSVKGKLITSRPPGQGFNISVPLLELICCLPNNIFLCKQSVCRSDGGPFFVFFFFQARNRPRRFQTTALMVFMMDSVGFFGRTRGIGAMAQSAQSGMACVCLHTPAVVVLGVCFFFFFPPSSNSCGADVHRTYTDDVHSATGDISSCVCGSVRC